MGGGAAATTFYIPPKQTWLTAAKGKGLEINGTFSRKGGVIYMEMSFANKAMQPMNAFGIQLNKNRCDVISIGSYSILGRKIIVFFT